MDSSETAKSVILDSIPIPLLQDLLTQRDLHGAFGALTRYVDSQLLGSVHCIILLHNPEKKCLYLGSGPCSLFTAQDKVREIILPISPDGTPCSRAAYFKKPVLAKNLDSGLDAHHDIVKLLNARANYAFPILSSKNELLGVFSIFYAHSLEKEPLESSVFRTLTGLAALILERYQAQNETNALLNELSTSKERLSLALQSQKMGVWDWHIQSNKLFWDDKMFELFGLRHQKGLNIMETWARCVLPEDLKATFGRLDHALFESKPFEHQFRILKHGEIRHIATTGTLLRDSEGRAYRMTGLNWDISDKVLASKKIENEKAKLVAASKMASLGEMASGVAHEINNPLTIILNRANHLKSMLQDNKFDKNWGVKELEKIENTVERIAKIVRGLNAFSRNADNDPMISCELNSIIDESLELCRERFKKNSIALRLIGPQNIVSLKCRPSQISQVLLNILNNSFDAIVGSNNPWIEMTTNLTNSVAQIRITDCGDGIPLSVADKVMDPFFTTKEVGKGTGLGLPIAKGIIEEHGGNFYLERESENTCFVIELPLEQLLPTSTENLVNL